MSVQNPEMFRCTDDAKMDWLDFNAFKLAKFVSGVFFSSVSFLSF